MAGKYQAYSEYKDSGIEWLGSIPSGWAARQLKFLCSCNDETLPDSVNPEYEIEYVDIGSVSAIDGIQKTERLLFKASPSRAKRIVRDGDVIISTVRTYLEAIAPIDNPPNNLIVSTGFAVIRPNSNLDKGYAAYCLRANGFIKEVVAQSVGISYPAINASDLINIKTPVPSLLEQIKIASFLDNETGKIDGLIEKQRLLIKLLKEKRQAVISHAVTKGLNPSAPMKDSGVEWLGDVPAHWDVKKLKFACELITEKISTDKKDVVALENIESWSGKYINTDSQYTGDDVGFISGDILFGKLRPYLAKVYAAKNDGVAFGDLLVYRPITSILSKYSFYQMISEEFISIVDSSTYGSKMPRASSEFINEMPFLIPPVDEQKEIIKLVESKLQKFETLMNNSMDAITLMKERRTALISAAVTGKIDVRDWQEPQEAKKKTQDKKEQAA